MASVRQARQQCPPQPAACACDLRGAFAAVKAATSPHLTLSAAGLALDRHHCAHLFGGPGAAAQLLRSARN